MDERRGTLIRHGFEPAMVPGSTLPCVPCSRASGDSISSRSASRSSPVRRAVPETKSSGGSVDDDGNNRVRGAVPHGPTSGFCPRVVWCGCTLVPRTCLVHNPPLSGPTANFCCPSFFNDVVVHDDDDDDHNICFPIFCSQSQLKAFAAQLANMAPPLLTAEPSGWPGWPGWPRRRFSLALDDASK